MRSSCGRTSCATWRWGRTTSPPPARAPTKSASRWRPPRSRSSWSSCRWRSWAARRSSGSRRSRSRSRARCSCRSSCRSRSTRCSRPTGRIPTSRPSERWFISRWLASRSTTGSTARPTRYKRVIGWALRHRWSMVALATASFVGAIALPALGIVGGSFFPVQDVLGVQRHHRDAAGLEHRVHEGQGRGGGAAGAIEARKWLHLHDHRRHGRPGQRVRRVDEAQRLRAAGAEARPGEAPGDRGPGDCAAEVARIGGRERLDQQGHASGT